MAYAQTAHSKGAASAPPLQSAPQRQLRTRPVDGSKPLFIVRSAKDLEVLAEEEGVRIDPVSLGFISSSQFVDEGSHAAPKKQRVQSIAVPPIQKEKRQIQLTDFVQPEYYIRSEIHRDVVNGLRLSDGSVVHYDMLEEDEEFIDKLNAKVNRNNLLLPKPIYMQADPGAVPPKQADTSPAQPAAAGAAAAAGGGPDSSNLENTEQQQQDSQQQQPGGAAAPTSGPFRLVLDPICLSNRSLFLSDLSFVKLMDALEKEAHARGGSELSVTADDAARIATHQLQLGLHAVISRQVHAHWQRRRQRLQKPLLRHLWPQSSPGDTSPLAVFRPRVGREKMTLRKQKRVGRDSLLRAEKLLDDCRLVEKVLRRMRTRDEKKEHLLEVRSLMFEQQRFELTDPLYSHPLWPQLRDKIKAAGARRADKRNERKALSQGIAAAAAAAACPPSAVHAGAGTVAGGPTAAAAAAGGRQLALTSSPAGLHLRRFGRRDKLGRQVASSSPSIILRPKANRHWKLPSHFFIGASPLPPSLVPVTTPLLFAAAAAQQQAAAATAGAAAPQTDGGSAQEDEGPQGPPKCRFTFIRRRGRGGRLWIDRLPYSPQQQQQLQHAQHQGGGKRAPRPWVNGSDTLGASSGGSFNPFEYQGEVEGAVGGPAEGASSFGAPQEAFGAPGDTAEGTWECEREDSDFEPPFASASGAVDPANCGGFHLFSIHMYLQQQQQQQLCFEGPSAAADWAGSEVEWQLLEQQSGATAAERQQQQQELRAAAEAARDKRNRLSPSHEEATEMAAAFSEWMQVITDQGQPGAEAAAVAVPPADEAAAGAGDNSTKSDAAAGDGFLSTGSREIQQQQQAVCAAPITQRGGAPQW
ncbi:hypothetical protein, conserved [Eimeria tenella]|uniref:Enhancer of polycomb-like protein n=1 Tax=Eimeria tenella TaxID=5802 RepID=U6L2F2_EIMTE|nr:hypothetical protein, conserved [Eimeria tenella]CDJ41925.1 hypothetical protein, conserved [Eimeria tenella]|eukprot:XP_013232675.1 hypothetical protein, conserved [Eimeria tenella]